MGRPSVMTEEVLGKLEEAFKYGATDKEACVYADIAPATLYKYQEENPEYSERKDQLKKLPIFTARKSVVDKLPRDADLALKFLERKRKKEFSTRVEEQHTLDVDTVGKILKGFGIAVDDGENKKAEGSSS